MHSTWSFGPLILWRKRCRSTIIFFSISSFPDRSKQDLCRSDPEWNVVSLRYFNPIGAHQSGDIGEHPNGVPSNLMPYVSQVAVGQRPHVNVFGNDYKTKDGTGKDLVYYGINNRSMQDVFVYRNFNAFCHSTIHFRSSRVERHPVKNNFQIYVWKILGENQIQCAYRQLSAFPWHYLFTHYWEPWEHCTASFYPC